MTALIQAEFTEAAVVEALENVIDPELGINIVDLGLVYSVTITDEARVEIIMTLTTPGCPLHASFVQEIERVLWQSIPDITGVDVQLVWDPPWNPIMISPRGRALLGIG